MGCIQGDSIEPFSLLAIVLQKYKNGHAVECESPINPDSINSAFFSDYVKDGIITDIKSMLRKGYSFTPIKISSGSQWMKAWA